MLVRFRRYREDFVGPEQPFVLHPDHQFVKVPLAQLEEIMVRCPREFGDPTRIIGGPEIPRLQHEREARE
jgi:hypothetical protein